MANQLGTKGNRAPFSPTLYHPDCVSSQKLRVVSPRNFQADARKQIRQEKSKRQNPARSKMQVHHAIAFEFHASSFWRRPKSYSHLFTAVLCSLPSLGSLHVYFRLSLSRTNNTSEPFETNSDTTSSTMRKFSTALKRAWQKNLGGMSLLWHRLNLFHILPLPMALPPFFCHFPRFRACTSKRSKSKQLRCTRDQSGTGHSGKEAQRSLCLWWDWWQDKGTYYW